jgi:Rne/Rng family ribonuclease
MQGKGARLTTYISLAGRLMVYMPQSQRSGVSRRLPEKERERLRRMVGEMRPKTGSIIIRTAAQRARKKDMQRDVEYLVKEWNDINERQKSAKPPTAVYTEPDLAVRVVRDYMTRDFQQVLIDNQSEYKRIADYLETTAPDEREIEAALRRKVPLPSGGYLVIDEAEALTAIDVNTGSYTGKKSLEDTVLKTNLEACVEVVRQLRLRDIGGIIVIDFIDMENRNNRERVLNTLEQELQKDRTKTQVVTLSKLGLVEMTRKNVTEGLSETLGHTCTKCEGRGLVFKD